MTTIPVTATQDLQKALDIMQSAIDDHAAPVGDVMRAASWHIEAALTKIQVLRCSTIAELDKL